MRLEQTNLSPAQQNAVLHTDGPCLIVAGPGSGKTHVLTHRVAYLITAKSIPATQIMVLTFTNKAAKEMKARVETLLGSDMSGLWIGTFHSLFAKILRTEAKALDFTADFTIYDRDDSKALVKTIITECKLDPEVYVPGAVLSRISYAKNSLVDERAYGEDPSWEEEDRQMRRPALKTIYAHYQGRCKSAGAMDFDDLLLYTHKLFETYPAIAEKWQRRFRYILVDEFQDTNNLQYAILKKLVALHQNLCVIGDDAQGIYAFRGGNIGHILSFQQTFPQARITKLEENYRSTALIVQAANKLIKHNIQHPKELFTNNQLGGPILVRELANDLEEARFIANDIFIQSHQKQLDYNCFAVLYRTNKQSRVLEEALRKHNIPYQVIGGLAFYQRKEVKDVLAYLRLLVNPHDEQALYRAINIPKRGIGPATLEKGRTYALANKISLWQALQEVSKWLQGVSSKSIEDFVALIEEHQAQLARDTVDVVALSLTKAAGIWKLLQNDKTPEGLSQYENLQNLLEAIASFVQETKENGTLAAFLQDIALVSSNESEEPTNQGKVTLMTMHAAKGSEYPHVYIAGMEEGLCPPLLTDDAHKSMEQEERRVVFVAITRAKHALTITHVKNRFNSGKLVPAYKSRFLEELDPRTTKVVKQGFNGWKSELPGKPSPEVAPSRQGHKKPLAAISQMAAEAHQLRVGMTVKHPKFGRGVIAVLETQGTHQKVAIDFISHGKKNLLLQYANLEPL